MNIEPAFFGVISCSSEIVVLITIGGIAVFSGNISKIEFMIGFVFNCLLIEA